MKSQPFGLGQPKGSPERHFEKHPKEGPKSKHCAPSRNGWFPLSFNLEAKKRFRPHLGYASFCRTVCFPVLGGSVKPLQGRAFLLAPATRSLSRSLLWLGSQSYCFVPIAFGLDSLIVSVPSSWRGIPKIDVGLFGTF